MLLSYRFNYAREWPTQSRRIRLTTKFVIMSTAGEAQEILGRGSIRSDQTEIRLVYTVPERPMGEQEDKSHRAKRLG
jgi:hypothetical protein